MNPTFAKAVRNSVVLGGLIMTALFGTAVAAGTGTDVQHTAVERADSAGEHAGDTTDPWT